MSQFKIPFLRYRIIDRELQRWPSVTSSRLKSIIENELGTTVTLRTVQHDLKDMAEDINLKFNAPILYDKKNKTYSYTDRTYSILHFGLKEEEIRAMKFYASCLSLYSDFSIFKSFASAINKIVDGVNVRNRFGDTAIADLVIQTDTIPNVKGSEFISAVIEAISESRLIRFDYIKFHTPEIKQRELAPYMLKEYRNRWYILGIPAGNKKITTFCLDRVSNLAVTDRNFIKNNFDYKKYFEHSFGITTPDEPVQRIVLRFSSNEAPYIKSLPVHTTQEIVKETPKYTDISIHVIPSYELYEFILGKTPNVLVVSPKSIKTKIAGMLRKGDLLHASKNFFKRK